LSLPQLLFGLHRSGSGGGGLGGAGLGRHGFWGSIGDRLHLLNACQLILGILQAQFRPLDLQILPIQGKLGQGGVISKQGGTFGNLLPLLDVDLRHLLGGGEKHRLQLIRRHRSGGAFFISPVCGNEFIGIIDPHHLARFLGEIQGQATAQSCHQHQAHNGDPNFLLFHG